MSTGLLVVSHNGIGEELCAAASSIMKQQMPEVAQVSVPGDLSPDVLGQYADRIRSAMMALDQGDGVLVLTDVHGATPDNLARYFSQECNAVVISGVNLPMLLRVLNYAQQSIGELSEIATTGGKTGIVKDQA
ncbi:MAG: hypothetical protein AAF353_11955 [Pseudomonadota bacterium]